MSSKCTSHLHVRDIVDDHVGNDFNNDLILSQNVTGNEASNEVESLCSALRESRLENERLESRLNKQSALLHQCTEQLEQMKFANEQFQQRLSELQMRTVDSVNVKKLEEQLRAEASKSKRDFLKEKLTMAPVLATPT